MRSGRAFSLMLGFVRATSLASALALAACGGNAPGQAGAQSDGSVDAQASTSDAASPQVDQARERAEEAGGQPDVAAEIASEAPELDGDEPQVDAAEGPADATNATDGNWSGSLD